jgi:hypothetical protein
MSTRSCDTRAENPEQKQNKTEQNTNTQPKTHNIAPTDEHAQLRHTRRESGRVLHQIDQSTGSGNQNVDANAHVIEHALIKGRKKEIQSECLVAKAKQVMTDRNERD